MRYVVNYRGYRIVREAANQPFRIFQIVNMGNGERPIPGEYRDFAAARREVDWMKG